MYTMMSCLSFLLSSLWLAESWSIAKPDCKNLCGKVKIPYPFGIGVNCFHDPSYAIICNESSNHPKPFLQYQNLNLEVINITWPGRYAYDDQQLLTILTPARNICRANDIGFHRVDFRGSPYRFSRRDNVFMVSGCIGSAVLKNQSGQIITGCASVCPDHMNTSGCYGEGCCLSTLMPSPTSDFYENDQQGLDFYEIDIDHEAPTNSNSTCTWTAGLIMYGSVGRIARNLPNLNSFPTLVEWKFNNLSSLTNYHNFWCFDNGRQYCSCTLPYGARNPFLPYGCKVLPECRKCLDHCFINKTTSQPYCEKKFHSKQPLILGFGIGMGLVLLILGSYWVYRLIKWRRQIWQRAKCFKRNGGLLLQQQMSSSEGVVEKMSIFTVIELDKATDSFHENRVLGQGGQGTVYKGMLMDGRLVAVKKSTKVDDGQLDQFINEVVLLSQINHRNVVKLLGCCLETEVPLLVYELIPNGTLYQHIHDPTEDFHVSWKMRLQIAAESAGALAYLHSSSSAPIYHRDIKASNILLDDKYRAKVSDFGTSKAINIEQTHVTTRVQGTYGYLDPEYFQSNQFIEKSDVYSFGVVLAELITGQKPICLTESGVWKSLAVEFICQMEMSCLFDIVDTRIVEEGKKEEFIVVAELARRCLNMNGKQRPTMKEVATILDGIKSSPNSKKPNSENGKCVVTEISNSGPSTTTTDMFFTATSSFSSLSIEALPLMSDMQ